MSLAIDRGYVKNEDTVVQVLLADGWHHVSDYEEYEESYFAMGSMCSEWWFRADEVVELSEPFTETFCLAGPRSSILAQRSK